MFGYTPTQLAADPQRVAWTKTLEAAAEPAAMDSWVPYERLPAEQGLEPEGWGGVDAVPARLEEPVSEPDLLPPDVAESA